MKEFIVLDRVSREGPEFFREQLKTIWVLGSRYSSSKANSTRFRPFAFAR
jgi:hypothetical protein